jgi:magnesium transporter
MIGMSRNETCQLYTYDSENLNIQLDSPNYFSDFFKLENLQKPSVSWLNFHSLTDEEDITKLCDHLSIDKLTQEDIFNPKKRSKLEEYPTYMFFTVLSALTDVLDTNILHKEQITFVLGEGFLISFQNKKSNHFEDVRDRIEKKRGKIRHKQADFLLFRLLESILDNYFEVLEDISTTVDLLDTKITKSKESQLLLKIETQKRKLIELRKVVQPFREITIQLDKINSPLIHKSNHHYFSDLKENCLLLLEEIDAHKQILESLANLHFAVQGQRMNEIMKTLTIVSSIFIPLTFIVGIYGMNFENMPELKSKQGYFVVLGVMFFITLILIFYFNRIGWLSNKNKQEE